MKTMQSQTDPADEDYAAIAESVKSGEYFRKARAMYDLSVHDPMAERYLYLFITALSLLSFIIAFSAMQSLYPLQTPVPFIYSTNNIADDIPHIQSLLARKGENPSAALLRFLVQNYVTLHEEYNIDTFDRDVSGVESQSAPAVAAEFRQAVDPRNPDSPVALYQRHSKRRITIVSSRRIGEADAMEVTYEAAVEGKGEGKKSRWQANIAFNYSGLALDEKTGKVNPVSFVVTQYRSKRLQDIK